MTCPACGHAAEAGAKFCSECGRPLGLSARSVPAPRSYTPAHLAEKILSSRSVLQGERKHVTVLFADVKGSLDLAAQVDAETWHQILDGFFAILTDGIHRFEGTINQYTGDGIMALFGAPIAHEDHAQRACHAALALRSDLRRYADTIRVEHGLSFSVRMGLNSGEVVVGRIGDDLRMDYTAQGHTVGMAARMEHLAEPGTVLVSQATAQLAQGYFSLRSLGSAHIKGVREPVQVFELEGSGPLHTRLDRSRARGFAAFVGRGDEMTVLDDALNTALSGSGAVVGVEGDGGVGKSRLCAEFVARCRERGISVYEAHCPAHGRALSFLPILALLRSYFSIAERDDAAAAREKIAGRLLVHDDSARAALPILHDFLGVADPLQPPPRMDPEARQRLLYGFIRRLAAAHRDDETVVLFIDDLHWIDEASDAFVSQLVDSTAGRRTLLLLNYRPEYRASWMSEPAFRPLALAPLAQKATDALLDDLLGTDHTLLPLRKLIRERTGGNPFFIEEVVESLVSDGTLETSETGITLRRAVSDIRIPDSVHAVLASRIDKLGESDKAVLQTAAVVGKSFDFPVLHRLLQVLEEVDAADLEDALRRLAAAHLVAPTGPPSEGRFAFKHPLTQEVAYRSQLSSRRERVHRAVAQVVEEMNTGKRDEVAALLAHHLEQARDTLEAARWHRRAAHRAGVNDMTTAARHWESVRRLAADLPDSLEILDLRLHADLRLLDLGWRSGLSPAAAEPLFAEGRTLATQLGDTPSVAALFNMYGIVVGMSGDVEGGLVFVREGARVAQQTEDVGLKLANTVALVQALSMSGAMQEALTALSAALGPEPYNFDLGASSGGGFSPSLYLVMMRGHLYTEMGRLRQAATDLERVFAVGRERGEAEILGWAHEMAVYLHLATGTIGPALEHARLSVDSAERIGSPLSCASAYYSLGAVHLAAAGWHEAMRVIECGLKLIRERRTGRHWEARGLALLAEGLAGAGEPARARATADEAEAASLRSGDRPFECISALATVNARMQIDGVAESAAIEAALSRVDAIVTKSGAQLYAPWVHEARAALAAARGQTKERERELREAHRLFAAMGADGHAARITAVLAST